MIHVLIQCNITSDLYRPMITVIVPLPGSLITNPVTSWFECVDPMKYIQALLY